MPLARLAWFRRIIYGFVPIDVLISQSWVRGHARLSGELYHPLLISRLLRLPIPTLATTTLLAVLLLLASIVAACGWQPRLAGAAVALLYLAWMLVAMSYGKVDHDRLAFLTALAVLPTLGRARTDDQRRSPAVGWALRCVQVAVVLTYFYASWAKIRFGGWNWPTGATLERALLRRATPVSRWLIDQPEILVSMQFAMIGLELMSPLILFARSDRARSAVALFLWGFHATVFVGVSIIFLPHSVAICAFLPLEKLNVVLARFRSRWRRAVHRTAPVPSS